MFLPSSLGDVMKKCMETRNPVAKNCYKFNKPKVVQSKKLYKREKVKI